MKYRIKALREAKGITQEELSRKSGVSRATIWALESGENKITTTKTLYNIASALDVDMEALFYAAEA